MLQSWCSLSCSFGPVVLWSVVCGLRAPWHHRACQHRLDNFAALIRGYVAPLGFKPVAYFHIVEVMLFHPPLFVHSKMASPIDASSCGIEQCLICAMTADR